MAKGFKLASGGGFKASPPKLNFGGGAGRTNPLEIWAAKQMMQPKMEQNKRTQDIQNIGPVIQGIANAVPGGIAPDTKVSIGDISVTPNPKRSLEESQALGGADAITNHIDYIRSLQSDSERFRNIFSKATFRLGGDKGHLGPFPTTYGDKEAQKLKFSLDDMANRLIYLFSGKQINEQEYKRLSNALPSYTDITDPTDTSFSTLNFKLDSFSNALGGIKNRLVQGGNYDARIWEGPIENTGNNQPMNIQGSQSPIPGSPGFQGQVPVQDVKARLRKRYLTGA